MDDPWYKTTFQSNALDTPLSLEVPHDVFSTQRIDEGTLLLLQNLPKSVPTRILDMGCGYGALGLPIAKKYPHAHLEMVDRDLLATKFTRRNAEKNRLSNVECYGSLGFREVSSREKRYDWILCNVPARIGAPFIRQFMESSCKRLSPDGEVRVVVIHDLGTVFEELARTYEWDLSETARGPRHIVYRMTKGVDKKIELNDLDLYRRDEVNLDQVSLLRPFDLGGDDPKRLLTGLPLLFESFPRQKSPEKCLVFRCGYGQIALTCASRWLNATVVALDRDLLATTFTSLNSLKLGVSDRVEVRAVAHFPDALHSNEKFDLITGEISPSAGIEVATAEISAVHRHLSEEGQASILCLEKIEKEWMKTISSRTGLRMHSLMKRAGYSVVSLTK